MTAFRPVSARLTLIALTTGAICALGSCAKQNLAPLQQMFAQKAPPNDITVNFCTDPSVTQKMYLKTLIVLDHSGSNQENYLMASNGAPSLPFTLSTTYATDPTGSLRYGSVTTPGTLLNYLSTTPPNNPADPTRFFALVDFNASETTYPPNSSGFTSDIPAFYNYVLRDSGQSAAGGTGHPNDAGDTDYIGALTAAYNIINSDIQSAVTCAGLPVGSASPGSWCPTPGVQIASNYVVVFMSDGSPIINITGVGQTSGGQIVVTGPIQITKEPSTQILGQVATIMGLTANTKFVAGINFFTTYYYYPGNIDQSGQQLLASMAKVGNGIAYNALSGTSIDYNQFAPPTRQIKETLSDIFVTNASVAWWTDGKLHADTDMDGLPDEIETQWGSDPTQADTYGTGVTDLVRYIASGAQACVLMGKNGICADPPVNYANTLCKGVRNGPVAGRPGAIQFQASDPDGLNDCEKIVLNDGGGVDNPDSNGDILPDWLEFKNGVPFQIGAISANAQPDLDGYTDYQKIKLSLPVGVPYTQLLAATPANYQLDLLSTSDVQDCYQLNVTQLPVLGPNNTIRVDVVLKTGILQDSYVYRVGKKQLNGTSQVITFDDWNNAAEQAAGTWKSWP